MTAYIDRDQFVEALKGVSKDHRSKMAECAGKGDPNMAAFHELSYQIVDGIVLALMITPAKEIE